MLPLTIAFAAVAAAGYVVYRMAVDNEQVGRRFARAWDAVRLTFEGLEQAIGSGEFTGTVRDELNRAENQGIRQFVLRVSGLIFRVRQFIEGFVEEWRRASVRIAPAFDR